MEKPSHLYSNKWHEHTPGFHTGTRLCDPPHRPIAHIALTAFPVINYLLLLITSLRP